MVNNLTILTYILYFVYLQLAVAVVVVLAFIK